MALSPRVCVLAIALAGAALTGCGKDRSVGTIITASSEAGVKAFFTPRRVDGRWVEGAIHLENTSGKPIQVTNFQIGNTYPGFKLQVENQPIISAVQDVHVNPWAGFVVTGANNGQISELPAGVAVDLEFKWKLITEPSKKKDYAFTIIVSGLVQDGKPLPNVTISRPAL